MELEEEPVYTDETLHLEAGDVLLQYTDGVPEATDAQGELFGEERLLDALNRAPTADPSALLSYLHGEIRAFVRDEPQFDDITMLAIRQNSTGRETDANTRKAYAGEDTLP